MNQLAELHDLDAPQLREMVLSLLAKVEARDRELAFKQATVDRIKQEMAVLKRLKLAAKSEHHRAEQKSLIEGGVDADLEALARVLDKLAPETGVTEDTPRPRRQPLPPYLPRREIHHEPHSTNCACGCMMKRIGERRRRLPPRPTPAARLQGVPVH